MKKSCRNCGFSKTFGCTEPNFVSTKNVTCGSFSMWKPRPRLGRIINFIKRLFKIRSV